MSCSTSNKIGKNKDICWECITPIAETPDIQNLIFKRYGDRSICIHVGNADCIYIKDKGAYFNVEDLEDIRKFLVGDERLNKDKIEMNRNLTVLVSDGFWKTLNDALVGANTLVGFYHYKHPHFSNFKGR